MKRAIQFGAGNIGRGFIGALLEKSGYHVVFADVNEEILNKINEAGYYTVNIMDTELQEEKISHISAMLSTGDEIVEEIAQCDFITTAVGLTVLPRIAPAIVKGIQKRFEQNKKESLNIVACENAIRASSQLKEAVEKLLSPDLKEYVETYIGFPDCSVDRIVPPVKSENIIDVAVESYYEWNVEKSAFKGKIPAITGMNLADNLMAYIERKLFTLNTGHCITAYLGSLKGYATINESIADATIFQIVKSAMQESGAGLIKKYGFEKETHFQYIDKIIKRFQNPYLKDEVSRVGREPLRKLSDTDRLIKPMMTAYEYQLPIEHLLMGVGAALHYNNPQDEQSVTLQKMIKEKGIKETICEISKIPANSDLAQKIELSYHNIKDAIMK